MKNPLIFTQPKVVMQSICDKIVLGNTLYVTGTTTLDKLEHAIDVFAMDYQALADKNERAKRTRRGLGNAHLILFYRNGIVQWWLFAKPESAGRHPIHSMENLRDALDKNQRIEIDGFELVRAPKVGSDGTKWTWRMTSSRLEEFHSNIVEAVRSRSHDRMRHVLTRLWLCPGFNGIRVQIGNLAVIYRAEIKRAGLKNAPMPSDKLYYLNRIDHTGISVKQLLAQTKVAA